MRIADEDFRLVHLFSPDGADQRQLLHEIRRDLIGQEAAVARRPLLRRSIGQPQTENALGGGIEQQETTVFVSHHDAIAHGVEHGLQDAGLSLEWLRGAVQRTGRMPDRSRLRPQQQFESATRAESRHFLVSAGCFVRNAHGTSA